MLERSYNVALIIYFSRFLFFFSIEDVALTVLCKQKTADTLRRVAAHDVALLSTLENEHACITRSFLIIYDAEFVQFG